MDVRLSPEQRALRDSVGQVMGRLGPKAVADLDDEERSGKLDAAVAASGWRELRAAGSGSDPLASAVEAALVAEELARGLADTPFLGPTLAADLRRRAAAAPATAPETVLFRPDLSAPATVDAGSASLSATAVDAGLPSVATGSATPSAVAVDAGHASVALALEPGPAGARLATVPIEAASPRVDLTRPSGVPAAGACPARVTGTRPLTEADLDSWTALGLALTCADLVGTMRGAVQLGCGYATVRRQYGSLIGSFQAVQHLLADAHVATEGSRSVALHAAWAVDALPPREALAAGAVAKAYCARAARTVCETVIQVHGGIGNTWDCLAHLFLRRSLLSADALGGVGLSLQRVMDHHAIGGDGHGLR
jgi:alkylation response protein AidB-like acyl-CoA dehydrogenase